MKMLIFLTRIHTSILSLSISIIINARNLILGEINSDVLFIAMSRFTSYRFILPEDPVFKTPDKSNFFFLNFRFIRGT